MISMPPSVTPAIFAVASLRVSSRPRTRRMLVVLFAILAVLLGGAGNIVFAQTAHFSGTITMSTVGDGFNGPLGVTMDSAGNLYVADCANNAVKEILAVNGSIPAIPTIVTLGSGFKSPIAVAVDGSGNVYVADAGNGAVKEILAVNGSIPASPTIRTLINLITMPDGVAVDSNGNVYLSLGCVTTSIGFSSVSAMSSASAISNSSVGTCGPLEELLAVNGSIPASPVVVTYSGFSGPAGITLDGSGDVYVANYADNTIKEILAVNGSVSPSSTIRTLAGIVSSTGPTGVALDGSGNVYAAVPSNNAIYKILAVNGSIPSSPTIVTVGSGLNNPTGVVVDSSGTVYVADAGNNRVAKTSPSIWNFGAVNIGTASPVTPMLLNFDTGGTLGSMAVLTQGATGLDFANVGTGTCNANTNYAAGQSCTVNVTFTPRFAGIRTGAVVAYDSTGIAIANGYMVGTGVGPQIAFQPVTLSTLSSSLNNPAGVAVDGNGNIYVADYGSNTVKEILAVNGSIPASPTIRILGTGFKQPSSVALDSSGDVYVADTGNNAVKEILAVQGGIPASPAIVTLGSGFNSPYGVAVDRAGNVFVADTGNSAVKEILTVNGSIPASPTVLTLETGGTVYWVAVDGSGNVYLTGSTPPVVELLAVSGSIPPSPTIRFFGGTLSNSTGLAVDSSGNVYVANNQNSVSEIHAVNGSIPASPTITTLSSAFKYPIGLAVDSSGNIYIADSGNYRVAKLDFADPPSLSFATTAVGSVSSDSPQPVIVENIGNAPLNFPIPLTGNNPKIGANFSIGNSSTCPSLSPTSYQPGILPPGASCVMPVSFAPTLTGALSSSLVLTDNNLNAAAPGYATQSIKLSGTGLQPPPTFTLMAPSNITVIQGASSTSTIQVIPGTGFTGSVNMAVNGLPSGVTASFTPNPTTGTSVLTLTASNMATRGTVIVVINGIDGTQSATASMQVTVASPPPSFSLGINPSSLTVYQGNSGTSAISMVGQNGFSGSVNLATSGLPNGVTSVFSPNPTTGTSVLTFTASSTAVVGQALVTITGNSGTLTGTNGVSLTIAPPPGFMPSSENFGSVNIGTASSVQTLTYTFGSAVTLGSTAVLTQGATGLDFADAGLDTCVAGTAYTAGQSCTMNVTFAPKFAGTRYGAVVHNDNNGNVIATNYLQGTGVGPQINFLPNTESIVASASGGLSFPYGVAVDGSGNIYIVDDVNFVVQKETPSGSGYTQTTIPTSSLFYPSSVAVDGAGNVYIADTDNSRVLKETPSTAGYTETVIASLSTIGFDYPCAVAVDSTGNVFFTGAGTARLYEETPSADGYIQSIIPTPGATSLAGVAVDGNGNIYVVDYVNAQVIKETPSADGYSQGTLPTSGLIMPYGVAVDGNGNVYIADIQGKQVVKETLSAGTFTQSMLSTGPLVAPFAVAVDGSGNVYIADAGNSQVLKEDFADAPSLTFASAAVGSTSPDSPQTVTVENVGNAALSFPIPASDNNPSISTSFTLNSVGDSACPLVSSGSSTAGTLAAGASCQLAIGFTPTTAGALSGSLVLTDNNLNAAAPGYAEQNITLNGTGTQATPTITWATPAAITYGTPLSAMQLSATSTVDGTFSYSPAEGTVLTAGQQTLTVTFTPTDSTNYTTATSSVTLMINQATPTITWATPAAIVYGTQLSAIQFNATSTVAGSFTYSPTTGIVLGAGQQTLTATFMPADTIDYTTATASVTMTVNKAAPAISWPIPAPITYGTPVGDSQLNTTVAIAGTFAYSPVSGTVLGAGQQTLTSTFTPTDTADYLPTTASVTLTVNKATPTITWTTPATINYGTTLSGTQLNAKSTVAGSFSYSPAAGTVLNAGTQTLAATFTPTDGADYSVAAASVNLTVNKAKLTIAWATPAAISYGTALSGTQLNATSTADGTFTYSPEAGTVLGVGSHTLSVTFKPTNAANYTTASATATVTLTVNKATPSINWATPTAITYGTALGGAQLNASSSVAGKLTYSPVAGTILTAGSHALSVTFAPTDSTDYTTATTSVTLPVNRATPTVKLTSSANSIAYGKSLTFTTTMTGNGVRPTGTASFFDGTTPLGTSTLNAGGVATYSTNRLALGKHSITTSYSGDGNYANATSTAITVTVTAH